MDLDKDQNGRPSYIIVVGSGYSGSGAVFDYLSGRPDVATTISGVEFRLGLDPGGLEDLSYALGEGFHPNRASTAIKNFQDLCRRYGRSKSALPPGLGYVDLIPEYESVIEAYINAIVDIEFHAMPYVELTKLSPLMAFFVTTARSYYKRKKKKPPLGNVKLSISKEEFDRITATFIDSLLQHDDSVSRSLPQLVNQAGSYWHPLGSTNWFGKRHIITVTRDPRDIYADLKSMGYAYPGADVGLFIDWYENVSKRVATQEWESDEVVQIQFEEITRNPDEECKKLLSRLGLSVDIGSSYNLSDSYKNVGQYKKELDATEIGMIENRLERFLQDI